MPSETVLSATRPPFPTYLLPSLNFPSPFRPFRRRHSSAASFSSSTFSAASPSSVTSSISSIISPTSSTNTTPSSSPPNPEYFGQRHRIYNDTFAVREQPDEEELEEEEESFGTSLGKIQPDTLKCSTCATDLAFASQVVSKGFTGRHGRAYLVSAPPFKPSSKSIQLEKDKDANRDLINTKIGRPVNRQLVTGAHVVADISCVVCNCVVGWKYVDAKEPAQRYKIGKFILETRRVVGGKVWEDLDCFAAGGDSDKLTAMVNHGKGMGEEDEVNFDSEDEDECDDLFAGVWDAEVVRKRRERRFGVRMKVGED